MRIGLIIYGRLETLTGGYLYDRMVVEGLRRVGHAVEVISLTAGSYGHRLGQGVWSGLCARLLAGRFDLLLQDELCHPSLVPVNPRLRRLNGPPVVAIVHHLLCREPRPGWRNWLLALVERRYLAAVDGCIFNSRTTRSTVTALVGDRLPHVIAPPAGDRFGDPLDLEAIRARTRRSGPLELVFVGIVIPRKGLSPLLTALAGVDRDLWRLTVVGSLDSDPAHALAVRHQVERLGLAGSVRFLGACPDDRLVEILRGSHVLCMPYAYEGFGIAMLEAMVFGLPAIGSREGAAGETIRHGRNGFLLATDDVAGLAPLLAHLHRDREELLRLSLAARQTFAQHPRWQDSVTAIHDFLTAMNEGAARGQRPGAGRSTEPSETGNRHGSG